MSERRFIPTDYRTVSFKTNDGAEIARIRTEALQLSIRQQANQIMEMREPWAR